MSAAELIDRLTALGARLVWKAGKPSLWTPPGTSAEGLAAALTEHRGEVLMHFGRAEEPTGEHKCGECGRTVFVWRDDMDMGYQACFASGDCRVMCPFWRRGLGPDWMPRARESEEWSRRKKAEHREKAEEPIPE